MSPAAAVHLQSPIQPSSMQNPNSIPDATSHPPFDQSAFNFARFSESNETSNPSSFSNASNAFEFAAPFAQPGASSTASSSSRPRPRLVKLRKQSASQHVRSRSRTATGEFTSGFNPFRSTVGSSDQVNSCNSDSESLNSHLKFEDIGFVFGAQRSEFTEELGGSVERGEVENERESEIKRGDPVEFIFNGKRNDVELDSREEGEKAELDSEIEHCSGFVYCADQKDSDSNLNVVDEVYSKDVENSCVDNGEEANSETEAKCVKKDSFVFVFGGDHTGKTPNFNVKTQEFLDSMGKLNCDMGPLNPKTETLSGSSIRPDHDYHLNDDKSRSGCTSGTAHANSTFPAHSLTDEMKKLNINNSEKASGDGINVDSKNSFVNSNDCFVFGRSEKATVSSSASSGVNVDVHQSCPNVASENTDGFTTCKRNDVQNGIGCNIARGSAGISFSEPSSSQESVGNSNSGKIPECQESENLQVHEAKASFSFSSFGTDSQSESHVSANHSKGVDQDKYYNGFTNIPKGPEEPSMDFKPPTWDPSCFKENLFPASLKKAGSKLKGRFFKERGAKEVRRKLKSLSLNKKHIKKDHLSKGSSPPDTSDSCGSYSPMDFSPYCESRDEDQDVKASAELNEPSILDHSNVPSEIPICSDDKVEHSATVGSREDIYTQNYRNEAPNESKPSSSNVKSYVSDSQLSGDEAACPSFNKEHVCSSSRAGASADAGAAFKSSTDQFGSAPNLGDSTQNLFTFSASSTRESTVPSVKRKQKKKYRRKVGIDSFIITPNLNEKFGSSDPFPPSSYTNLSMNRSENNDQLKGGDFTPLATTQEICEKWKSRGNQAYKAGDLSKAEDFYTIGINSIPPSERSGCSSNLLLLCYSNRAATRIGLGRIREALGDCLMASAFDSTFQKVQMRTANCYLMLGELENAQQYFNKCLGSSNGVCLDRRVIVEAAEGLQKAKNVAECTNSASELLKKKDSDAAGKALELISKALSISLYSEKLLQMKAEALYLLRKYDVAIQLCEQSQCLAEKNLANSTENVNASTHDSNICLRLWRWSLISKCHFHLGRLEASLNTLEKLQKAVSLNKFDENIEDSLSLATTIQDLLRHKNAGNEYFKLKKYTEAIEEYTVALSTNTKSRPFVAICFCNRAAAHQALGQITDAISDCSMAMALDGNYAKAISRRATLHEMVRDYEQAACDLRRLLSILENQSDEKNKQSGAPDGSNGVVKESRQVRQHLHSVEEKAKKETPLDFYLILGVKPTDTAADIKKAYHKAALRHHPDKAGQLLARSEAGDEGQIWREISQEVYEDADRLFKMIGEAYAELSDPTKRSEYDFEEEIRKAKQSNRGGGTSRRSSDFNGFGRQSSDFYSYRTSDRSSNRRHGRDHWKTYGDSYSRW